MDKFVGRWKKQAGPPVLPRAQLGLLDVGEVGGWSWAWEKAEQSWQLLGLHCLQATTVLWGGCLTGKRPQLAFCCHLQFWPGLGELGGWDNATLAQKITRPISPLLLAGFP